MNRFFAHVASFEIIQELDESNLRLPDKEPLGLRKVVLLNGWGEANFVLFDEPFCSGNLFLTPIRPEFSELCNHVGWHPVVGVNNGAE